MSNFLNAVSKKNTTTWNGAVSNSTSGNLIVDYFGKCGSYRGRTLEEVNSSAASIFGTDELLATKIVFYNRLITRKCKGFVEQTSVQRGQGQKDEFVKSLAWMETNRYDLLKKNLWLVPEVGSWKDLWYDSPVSGFFHYTDPKLVYPLIKQGLTNEYHRGLIAKFLPKIRSKKNTTNERHKRMNAFARGLCAHLKWTERDYRTFKSDPKNTAHLWQRFMSANKWQDIDFGKIPGKALFKMVGSKKNVLGRHNLESKYETWVDAQPVVKFNGYPYELLLQAKQNRNKIQSSTLNKQFDQLLATAKDGVNPELLAKGVWCALDTSSSMGCLGAFGGDKIRPIDICVGLGIYFSSLIEGSFKDHVIMFDSQSKVKKLSGKFCDKVDQLRKEATAWGSTNFQSVIDEIVRVRRTSPNIPVEEYPQVLLVVSDMQFNPSDGRDFRGNEQTNYEAAMKKLRSVGLPDMTIIWWNVNGAKSNDFPSTINDAGTVLISGMDGAIVSSILSCDTVTDKTTGEKRKATPYEQMVNALDQEVLNLVKL
jgi:hypothetical protein